MNKQTYEQLNEYVTDDTADVVITSDMSEEDIGVQLAKIFTNIAEERTQIVEINGRGFLVESTDVDEMAEYYTQMAKDDAINAQVNERGL